MESSRKLFRFLAWPGVILLQLIATQVVTFIVSFLVPGMGDNQQFLPSYLVVILGITFTAGIFLVGWLAIKWHWLDLSPMVPARLLGTLVGAFLPMVVWLIVFQRIEVGSPSFFFSIVAGILGFYLPGWVCSS